MRRLLALFVRHLCTPPTLERILIETAVLLALHFALVFALARVRLLEHLLSPGPESGAALVVTAMFLVLRIFVIVLLPGWLIMRIWLFASRPAHPPRH